MLIGLMACNTTPKLAHEPISCLGIPVIPERLKLEDEEVEMLSTETVDKIVERIAIYKQRIESQCSLNENHDKLHGE